MQFIHIGFHAVRDQARVPQSVRHSASGQEQRRGRGPQVPQTGVRLRGAEGRLEAAQVRRGAEEWTAQLEVGHVLLQACAQNGSAGDEHHPVRHPDGRPVHHCVGSVRGEEVHDGWCGFD